MTIFHSAQRLLQGAPQSLPHSALGPAPSVGGGRDTLGVGLRPVHYSYIFEHQPKIDYFEIITENFVTKAPLPRQHLEKVRAAYPIVLHGVGLNLLGQAPLDERYLDSVAELADFVDAAFVTDHLCWTGAHGIVHHDLLPTPYVSDLVDFAAERAAYVQKRLGRPFGLENLSSYVSFQASTMTEWEFFRGVVERAGCYVMLDINNIYVSSVNHGFDPLSYLGAIDYSRVLQVHLAGHTREPEGMVVDTHDQPVCEEVWALYAHAWKLGGPFPTLLEWDSSIPPMPTVLAEVQKARAVRS